MDYRLHLLEDWHEPPAMPAPPVLLRMFEVASSLPLVPPALLASDQARCQAMEYRRRDEIHDCAVCGQRAHAAIIAGPSDLFGSARWLDACWRCYGDIKHDLGTLPDDEIARYWQQWAASDLPDAR
jgi:hypothetical protein